MFGESNFSALRTQKKQYLSDYDDGHSLPSDDSRYTNNSSFRKTQIYDTMKPQKLKKRCQKQKIKQHIKDQKNRTSANESFLKNEEQEKELQQDLDEETFQMLSQITQGFTKTFKDICNCWQLKEFPLIQYSKEEITNIIRVQRQKLIR